METADIKAARVRETITGNLSADWIRSRIYIPICFAFRRSNPRTNCIAL